MRFGYTLLYVDDVEKTLDFYEKALGLARKFVSIEGDRAYGELDTGTVTLGFVSHALVQSNGVETTRAQSDAPAPPFDIGFVTPDVDAAYATAIEAGALAVAQPQDKPWGERVAYVRDINGFLIAFGSGVDN